VVATLALHSIAEPVAVVARAQRLVRLEPTAVEADAPQVMQAPQMREEREEQMARVVLVVSLASGALIILVLVEPVGLWVSREPMVVQHRASLMLAFVAQVQAVPRDVA
jgi:hypothetical protein